MQYKVFDVVELENGNKAIIKEILKHRRYVIHILSKNGQDLGTKIINKSEIRRNLFLKKRDY